MDNIIELISGIDDYSVAVSAARWTVKQLKLPQDGEILMLSVIRHLLYKSTLFLFRR